MYTDASLRPHHDTTLPHTTLLLCLCLALIATVTTMAALSSLRPCSSRHITSLRLVNIRRRPLVHIITLLPVPTPPLPGRSQPASLPPATRFTCSHRCLLLLILPLPSVPGLVICSLACINPAVVDINGHV